MGESECFDVPRLRVARVDAGVDKWGVSGGGGDRAAGLMDSVRVIYYVAMEKFDTWLDQIHDEDDEFAYRALYAAYLSASSGFESKDVESSSARRSDGSFEIYAGRETIVLVDDAEREALAAYMVRRYCGDHYPDMGAWESAQHSGYVDDLHSWTSIGDRSSPGRTFESKTWWHRLISRLRPGR